MRTDRTSRGSRWPVTAGVAGVVVAACGAASTASAAGASPASHANLWLYFSIVFGIVVLPGMDMGLALATSLASGRRAAFAAIAGMVAGGGVHVAMGVLGVSVVLRTVPAAFQAMLWVGAAYVAWIGVAVMRGGFAPPDGPERTPTSARTAFARGALTNLLNPKAYLFTLAILPQFVRPEYGPLLPQTAAIVAINAATQVAVYGAVAWFADRARASLASRPAAGVWVARVVGGLLVAAALLTVGEGWRHR